VTRASTGPPLGLRGALAALALAAAPSAAAAAPSGPSRGVRRLALIAGANDGGPERARLRYAESDARTISGVLTELGGVSPADRVLLVDPDRAAMDAAFVRLAERLESVPAGQRTEVIVYYSGHSDERGLLLGTQRYSYKELRTAVKALDSDVRIAILDSCSSGALVQGKGGRHVPGFLDDGQNQVEGHAFLTSSAADEISQEAESIGGSFFTNALVTGLRGAADANQDRLVTLNEAYRFAYDETLSRTESTRFGAQHANFDMDLSGSGDLVMTDLRQRTAALDLDAGLEGRLFVRDPGGRIVAELGKSAGQDVALLVEPGTYTLTLERPEGMYRRTARVTGATPVAVDFSGFSALDVEATAARGSRVERREEAGAIEGVVRVAIDSLANIGLGETDDQDELEAGIITLGDTLDGAAFALGSSHYDEVRGAQMALGINTAGSSVQGAQLAVGMNSAEGTVQGFQGAAGLNWARSLDQGAQAAAGVNIVEEGSGAQLAAGANISEAGFRGAQLASGANISGGPVRGAQAAAGVNISGELRGFQGAVLNIAGDVHGAQLGVINTGRQLDGAMIGLINVAQGGDGATIGLLNFVRDGVHDVEIYGTPMATVASTVKLGTETVFTAWTGGYDNQSKLGLGAWYVGAGIGTRKGLGFLELDIDVGADAYGLFQDQLQEQPELLAPRLRLTLGWPIFDWLSPFVGMTASYGILLDQSPGARMPQGLVQFSGTGTEGGWVSWEGGVRF
jgi:hypothetical protein